MGVSFRTLLLIRVCRALGVLREGVYVFNLVLFQVL